MNEALKSESHADAPPELSVIITCYNEEQSIEEFHTRLTRTLESLEQRSEIIYINDGSCDGTYGALEAIFDCDPKVSYIADLCWNSGKAAAMTAGFTQARGEDFVFIDSDLQLAPEELPQVLLEYDKGYDLVSGYRVQRNDPFFRKFASLILNSLLRHLSSNSMRDFGCSFKIIRGDILRAFEYDAFKVFRPAFLVTKLTHCSETPVSHRPRPYGKSGWRFRGLASFFVEIIVSTWQRPFQVFGMVGALAVFFLLGLLALEQLSSLSLFDELSPAFMLILSAFNLLVIVGVLSTMGEFLMRYYGLRQPTPAYVIRTMKCREQRKTPSNES